MSNYFSGTKHPITGKIELAEWISNCFGHGHYGVKFKDGSVWHEIDIESKGEYNTETDIQVNDEPQERDFQGIFE